MTGPDPPEPAVRQTSVLFASICGARLQLGRRAISNGNLRVGLHEYAFHHLKYSGNPNPAPAPAPAPVKTGWAPNRTTYGPRLPGGAALVRLGNAAPNPLK